MIDEKVGSAHVRSGPALVIEEKVGRTPVRSRSVSLGSGSGESTQVRTRFTLKTDHNWPMS